jgi:regulator of sigma E protease
VVFMLLSVVAAVAIFAILIVVHEAGHFAVAKRLGVRVLRFSIGYPPRIFGIRHGETDYALGATPFGGYVRMLGDEIADEPSADTIKSYLKEIAIDLVLAAKSAGWLKPTAKRTRKASQEVDESALKTVAIAFRQLESAGSNFVPQAAIAGGTGLASRQPESDGSHLVAAVMGRDLRHDEKLLLRQIDTCGSVKLAIDTLAETRPSALLEAFNSRAFPSQRLAKRFAIVLAGPLSNILFAPILMIIVFMIGIPTLLPVVGKVRKDMPAFAAGLRQGDRVTAVNGKKIESWDDLSDAVKAGGGAPLQLAITRGTAAAQLTVVPKQLPEETVYGTQAPTWVIGVTPRGDKITRSYGPVGAIRSGTVESAQLLATLCVGIAKIFEGATPVRQALGGPIMIAQMAGREAHQGFADVALFTVMLSLELGIINLLPVPLLDGGHLLFFAIEAVRGKPLKLRHREIAMQVGLFLLAVLMAFVILNDISRIVG